MAKQIPTVKGHWLLGNAMDMATGPHKFVAQAAKQNGGIAYFRILRRPSIAINNADYVRHILVKKHARYRRSFHYLNNPIMGDGLLSTDGAPWLKRRRQVQPAFTEETYRHLVKVTNDVSEKLLQSWVAASEAGQGVDVGADTQHLALSVMGHSLLSVEVGREQAIRFASALRDALRLMRKRNTSLFVLPYWLPTPLNLRLRATRRELDKFIWPIIQQRRNNASAHCSDLLGSLLAVRDPETDEVLSSRELLDETKTMFAAGYETTATSLAWSLYLLARNPEQAQHWYEELDSVLGQRDPDWEDIPRLTFTNQIINESLRLFPPVYTLVRKCVEEDEIDGYTIPRGSLLYISVLGIHHDEEQWTDPEAFRPQRFSEQWSRHAFLPFATGQHQCIGNNFSLIEMAVTLAKIGQRYRLEMLDEDPVGVKAYITLIPERPIMLRLIPR